MGRIFSWDFDERRFHNHRSKVSRILQQREAHFLVFSTFMVYFHSNLENFIILNMLIR